MLSHDSELTLLDALAPHIGGVPNLHALSELTTGASKRTLKLELSAASGIQVFALRVGAVESSLTLPLRDEAALMTLAAAAEVPVPTVICDLTLDIPEWGGLVTALLMPWLSGETRGHRIVSDPSFAELRGSLAAQCGDVLARIHALDTAQVEDRLPQYDTAQLVEETFARFSALKLTVPTIEAAVQWLRERIPTQSSTTLVHGDFRNGNLMVDKTQLVAVLDWELASLGDPLRDLGWLCVNSWRFGQARQVVGGFGDVEDLIQAYEARSGRSIDRDALRFWQVFGSFWWSITTLLMTAEWEHSGREGLERPVIGRRSTEAQIDMLNLICPGVANTVLLEQEQAAYPPYAAEPLISSVRSYLKALKPESESPQARFQRGIANNALGIVQRELERAVVNTQLNSREVQALLGDFEQSELTLLEQDLIKRIRDGSLSFADPEVCRYLTHSVIRQLGIDQPHYSGLQTALADNPQ